MRCQVSNIVRCQSNPSVGGSTRSNAGPRFITSADTARTFSIPTRTLNQRAALALWLSSAFGASVAVRVLTGNYGAADLGLEGSLIAGILGGYVTGLCSGVLISLRLSFCAMAYAPAKWRATPGPLVPRARIKYPKLRSS